MNYIVGILTGVIAGTLILSAIGVVYKVSLEHREAEAYYKTIKYGDVLKINDDFRGVLECKIIEKSQPHVSYNIIGLCVVEEISTELRYILDERELLDDVKALNN